ncbi:MULTISPECIES: ferritin-like domain-containing protein [unclassified Mesorhizobium]|uniref:ferritin-like domain-containing protein n=1 Tax=unclassified Mesorhizobium TaxID=325217 RepID=UPI0015E444D6|nr:MULTISPECIES: ferritin-like domain-containing protein [unclassified Mesorhizobium]
MSTRLESGIGNFFPGLECDLRNLERRFFPFVEVDTDFGQIIVISVDAAAAADSAGISATDIQSYRTLEDDIRRGGRWTVRTMAGDFGPLGPQTVTIADLTGVSFGDDRRPADAWVAIRMLRENSLVTLTLTRVSGPGEITLSGLRSRYLDANGALARMFEPGELTQSLCSPWTHDFRDCACFYWASNHPDIALPPLPVPAPPGNALQWNVDTAWERLDRSMQSPPIANALGSDQNPPRNSRVVPEMVHHQINRDWQLLNFVLERREQVTPYTPSNKNPSQAGPLPDLPTLIKHLRFAAGVEIAVMLEYLSAAWSLRKPDGLPQPLQNDLRAAFAEIRRIAIGEMRHIRAVNDVLAHLMPAGAFEPALAVAAEIPDGGKYRPLAFRSATIETIEDFVRIEAPSESVDGLYAPIYATLAGGIGTEEQVQSIRTVMSEGEDHHQTFLFIKEWLGRHVPDSVFLAGTDLAAPPATNGAHKTLQRRYRKLLEGLYDGYKAGMPRGAVSVNAARNVMLGSGGIEGALDSVAAKGFLAVFDPIADPRFASITRPNP